MGDPFLVMFVSVLKRKAWLSAADRVGTKIGLREEPETGGGTAFAS